MTTEPAQHHPFNLSRRFLGLSVVAIVIVGVVTSLLLTRFLSQKMLQQDAEAVRAFVQSIVKVENADRYFLGHTRLDGDIKEFFHHIASMPDVARANVYGKDRNILWSSDPQMSGKTFANNPELEQALLGRMAIESGTTTAARGAKPEHYSLGVARSNFVEIYVPVQDPHGEGIIGAVEIYRVPTALFETIATGQRMIWAGAAVGGIFLIAMLFGIVKRADRVMRSQHERLIETETLSALGEMALAVAHGIRNPLASIRSSAELWHEVADTDGRESAKDIMCEVDRLEKWIRELLSYSQPQEDQIGAVALTSIINESVTHLAREAQRREVLISVQLDDRLPCVAGDPSLLVQVFNSLIGNALEASVPGGDITIRKGNGARRNLLEIDIVDTGSGILPDHLGKVGSAFYTTKQKGLGLGLAMARRIVKRFGGDLVIASQFGRGTVVTITFQCVPQP
ncbi:MAG: ATP-binding protein [Noviherbaspirillum sp.]